MSVESAPQAVKGLVRDRRATVRVPATSANLGPGFDSMGLALGIHDVVTLSLAPAGLEVEVEGEGAAGVPLTEDHLVVRAVRAGLDHAGVPQPGIRLHCANSIPHGRGLGSSSAAVVAGLVAARGCLADPEALDDATVLALATAFEGHPDNAAPALLGGCTIAWSEHSGVPRAERIEIRSDLEAVVCVPSGELSTTTARAMLPALVAHPDASFNVGRAALLVHALTRRPDLLPEATEDRLHQTQRAPAMPETADLVHRVRELGAAAVVSGAGPSVLVLGARGEVLPAVRSALSGPAANRWTVLRPGIDTVGSLLATEGQ
ncbi:homoserine kinase [Kineosporia sp. J2-2]|uniref:Homoserine kinase n=1 Tax=Kineosporia corallincola TaxID=2835133 RepID=A0ABS5TEW1_9ACTN|nr:homoserine kinase [Kineosporia corallincola]MBT0768144.1 homoserine kinase [Kineosporia corallincola]